MSEEQPPEGGHHGKGFALNLPVWAWVIAAGAGVGLLWFARKKSAAAAPATDTSGTTDPGLGPQTEFIPVDQGLAQNQFDQLMAAIKGLQGAPSTPPPTGGTPPPPVKQPTPTPPAQSPPPPSGPQSNWYTAKSGDTFSKIASWYGHSWQELWDYQLQPGVRDPSTQATMRKRGPDHDLFNGSTVAIPASWRKR